MADVDEAERSRLDGLIRAALDHPRSPAASDRLARALLPLVHHAVGGCLIKYRAAFYHRGGKPDVEELVGAMFVRLLEHDGKPLRDWDREKPIAPYLRGIASFVVLDAIRLENQGRGERRDEPTAGAEIADLAIDDDLERRLSSRDELAYLLDLLRQKAPERELQVFELHYAQDISVQEGASILGIRPDAFSAALHRLRARLTELTALLRRSLAPPVSGAVLRSAEPRRKKMSGGEHDRQR